MNLHPDQSAALDSLRQGARVSVLTGGPGTGKTTVLRAVLEQVARGRIALAAPTGKAARRLSEATGREAKTIHRLLGPIVTPGLAGWSFQHNEDNPLEADWVIVDEASMIDVHLASALIRAIPRGARVLIVGDIDQLPPVGPGAFMRDLIASDTVPVFRLDTIKRQDPGLLVQACHAVRQGGIPDLDAAAQCRDEDDLWWIDAQPDAVFNQVIVWLGEVVESMDLDPLRDVQILAATRTKGPVSCRAFNWRLCEDSVDPADEAARPQLLADDRVIQLKNDYELDAMNGDIGVVMRRREAFQLREKGGPIKRTWLDVEMDGIAGREIPFDAFDNDLDLAYAVTVHKFQGSEIPVALIPVDASMGFFATRNWIYTAMSRAKRRCVLVGQRRALARMVEGRQPERETALEHLLRMARRNTGVGR